MSSSRLGLSFLATVLFVVGCAPPDESAVLGRNGPDLTYDEFVAQAYREPWEGGVYVVNGDTPVADEKALREFYDELFNDGELIVHAPGGVDAKWSATQKKNLTYCVANTFGTNKAAAVAAIAAATADWEAAADVDFVYLSAQDANCRANNNNVLFDVRPVSGQSYLARAFFPGDTRQNRNVLIDASAFGTTGWSLTGILRHELGHTLGFRHEHTRPEAGTCFEDSEWRPLTPYDSASVMHYPQCNGSANDLAMTAQDRAGAAALYGASGNPPPPPPEGTPQSGSVSDTISKNETIRYEPIAVVPGSEFVVRMTGSGDPDLYVRFGADPTKTQFDCRPYTSGAAETCTLTVPAGKSTAHLMVFGYRAGSYTLTANWVEP
jgi:hypothetical protein